VLLDLDDLDWERERSLGAEDEAAAYDRLANFYLGKTTRLLATSAADAEALALRTATPTTVVPNGVRPPAIPR